MKPLKSKGPAAEATANRTSIEVLPARKILQKEHSIELENYQSLFIANRYSLEPHIARLVCHLAGIGGAR
jgi:hypothetical protein